MAPRVFKIPDGKGGTAYQVQTPDGKWHDSDEAGNIISPEVEPLPQEPPTPREAQRKRESRGKKADTSYKDLPYVNFSIQVPKDDYRVLSSYVHWRGLFKGECAKGEFLLRAGLEVVRKDREYREFLRKNPELQG